MNVPRPQIVTASADGEDVTLLGDGVPLIVINREHATWLIVRLAQALVRR